MRFDAAQSAGLQIYAEIGLILFVVAFLFVLIRVVLLRREEAEQLGNLPLDDHGTGADGVRDEDEVG